MQNLNDKYVTKYILYLYLILILILIFIFLTLIWLLNIYIYIYLYLFMYINKGIKNSVTCLWTELYPNCILSWAETTRLTATLCTCWELQCWRETKISKEARAINSEIAKSNSLLSKLYPRLVKTNLGPSSKLKGPPVSSHDLISFIYYTIYLWFIYILYFNIN